MPFLPAFRRVAALTLVALPACLFSTLSAAEPASETSAFIHPINNAEDAPLVELGTSGLLRYALYSERGSDHARNIVPDFSRAGAVKTGEVELGPVGVALKKTRAATVLRDVRVSA